jgi:nucleoside-diphosphate-sugar epimerase
MNILISGINGFVGSNFTEKWKEHHLLYGLDINQTPKDEVKAIYGWDQLAEIPETDAIVHLAGKAHDTKNRSEAVEYFAVNTGLTQKIFDYFLQSSARKFIFFSSVKAAADSVPGDVLTEELVPAPVGPYGESKIKAEEYIRAKMQEQRIKRYTFCDRV